MTEGSEAYILKKLGSRHSDHALEFLSGHIKGKQTRTQPFFLYYPANSNHGPYTPDKKIGEKPVAGAARTKSGAPMDARHDYIYENDVALGRLIDWLEATPDPRRPKSKLIENTLVIFTSDNGPTYAGGVDSEFFNSAKPFKTEYGWAKGFLHEGGIRVPMIASWKNRINQGSSTDHLSAFQDILPTVLELCGIHHTNETDGLSFLNILLGWVQADKHDNLYL